MAATGENGRLDYYNSQARKTAVRSGAPVVAGRKRSLGAARASTALDGSAWIHRDKLAQIESRELEEAGLHVRRASHPASRSASRSASQTSGLRAHSRERYADGADGDEAIRSQYLAYERNGTMARSTEYTTTAGDDNDKDATEGAVLDWSPRTLGETGVEREPRSSGGKHHMFRPSTSRIPISKTSPVPVPHAVIERDSPLPRSRNSSGAWSGQHEDGIAFPRRSRRSQSIASQVYSDDHDNSQSQTPTHSRPTSSNLQASPQQTQIPDGSTPKAKVPNKTAPTSGARKAAAGRVVSNPAKPRVRSATQNQKDPPGRPSGTYNRPEGEAPWIATMYKPDPRLPPDQQMLPTHVKRMMQEQWEREGKTGSMYNREIDLLDDYSHAGPDVTSASADVQRLAPVPEPQAQMSPTMPPKEGPPSPGPWPLATPKSETASLRLGTTGSYRITPAISSPQRPVISPRVSEAPKAASTRLPDTGEKVGKEKKGCGCCIMM
ncbi:hypothetical protein LTR50_003947 [Elasticomyces elasticus]|nr:hypothetical protein LTR50_003947 [Elasticomyces elasticus]